MPHNEHGENSQSSSHAAIQPNLVKRKNKASMHAKQAGPSPENCVPALKMLCSEYGQDNNTGWHRCVFNDSALLSLTHITLSPWPYAVAGQKPLLD